jgi:hypothetical protein
VRFAAWCLALAAAAACSDTTSGGSSDAGSVFDAGADAARGVDAGLPDSSLSDVRVVDGSDAGPIADGAASDASDATAEADVAPTPFTVQTAAFAQGAAIPALHACNTHASPALSWTAGPAGTQSYAVVMIDKTRGGTNDEVHWVIFDIPAATRALGQGVLRQANLADPAGAKQVSSFDALPGYFGPCPPQGDGAHVYEWRVYAMPQANLATVTPATNKQTAQAAVMAGALAGTVNVVSGTYAR